MPIKVLKSKTMHSILCGIPHKISLLPSVAHVGPSHSAFPPMSFSSLAANTAWVQNNINIYICKSVLFLLLISTAKLKQKWIYVTAVLLTSLKTLKFKMRSNHISILLLLLLLQLLLVAGDNDMTTFYTKYVNNYSLEAPLQKKHIIQ